jgi:succinyl-CoA synthetase beta subunit
MKLYEYQGKELFRNAGIPVPRGRVVRGGLELDDTAKEFSLPVMVKAQLLSGKRGKAGLIKKIDRVEQLREIGDNWFGRKFNGSTIDTLLIEEVLNIDRELYLSVTIDSAAALPVIIACAQGGMNIEELSAQNPGAVSQTHVNIFRGIQPFQIRNIVRGLALDGPAAKAGAKLLTNLYQLFRQYDAELVEINPLVIDHQGNLWAADSKISIDDSALYRHKEFSKQIDHFTDVIEYQAYQDRLSYVTLDGNIGVIATGAGLTMTTLDLVNLNGGQPANFMDFGGDNYKNAANAIRTVLKNPKVEVLLLVTFGLFARADTIAEGVVQAVEEIKPTVPIVMAVRGTGEERAREMIKGIGIETYNDTEGAVKRAIQMLEA